MSDSFIWNNHLYDDKHAYVFKYGEAVVDLLQAQPGEKILDLGCGTGHLTELIAQKGIKVIGIDSSESMIAKAKGLFPEIEFHIQDARNFNFYEEFDGIFSNATLHWILEKEKVIENMYKSLKKGGRIAIEFGGKGNVNGIIDALKMTLLARGFEKNAAINFFYFPTLGKYTTLLEQAGFRILYASHFDRETELVDKEDGIKEWIYMFGSQFLVGLSEEDIEIVLNQTQESLRETHYKNGSWYADYVRLRIKAIKN